MVFDLIRLKNKLVDSILVETEYEFKKEELAGTDLIAPLKVFVKGKISRDVLEGFDLSLKVSGTMTLPCSITLKPVPVPFEIEIDGNLDELFEEIEENHKKIENSIDILPIIWENIVMEIPMKVTSPDVSSIKSEGDGWKLVTEKEQKEEINPALAKLKDLL